MYNINNTDRQFLFPFLLGGLAGGAITSVTRPRPVYVYPPQQTYYPYRPGYQYNYSGSGYYPY